VDLNTGVVEFKTPTTSSRRSFDHLMLATDPVTAARLTGDERRIEQTTSERVLGSAGKLNLMFRKPVRWKHGTDDPESDAAFRFIFAADTQTLRSSVSTSSGRLKTSLSVAPAPTPAVR
jgi:hypothetical protein